MISKSLFCTIIISLLLGFEGFKTNNLSMILQSIFFALLMIELNHIKTMIKNIPPWY